MDLMVCGCVLRLKEDKRCEQRFWRSQVARALDFCLMTRLGLRLNIRCSWSGQYAEVNSNVCTLSSVILYKAEEFTIHRFLPNTGSIEIPSSQAAALITPRSVRMRHI